MLELKSNVDEEIDKVKNLLELYHNITTLQESEEYLTAQDIAEIFDCTVVSAREYMNRPDFPLIECGESRKVNRMAFLLYNQSRRIKIPTEPLHLYSASNRHGGAA